MDVAATALVQIVAPGVEIRECQGAGVILGFDPIGRAGAVRRRGPMPDDRDGDSHHLAFLHVAQFRTGAAIDGARRQME